MPSRAHLSSATDQWPTPQDFFDRLHAEFGFVLDVCADADNAKAPAYYALDHSDPTRRDGLAQDWAAEAARLDGATWMNPPYGRPIVAWMAKARQSAAAGGTVVALVPVRADTAWWHEHVLGSGAEVRYVRGRLTFGAATNTAAFASAVVIYRPTDTPGQPGPVSTMPSKPHGIRASTAPDARSRNDGSDVSPVQFALAGPVRHDTTIAAEGGTRADDCRHRRAGLVGRSVRVGPDQHATARQPYAWRRDATSNGGAGSMRRVSLASRSEPAGPPLPER